MVEPEESRDGLHEFVAVLLRRKAVVLIPIIVTPLLALANVAFEQPIYSASADVLITTGSVASALSDLPGLAQTDQPERNARTQVELARLPIVAQRVINRAPTFEDSTDFLARSSVSAQSDADILRFSVDDPDSEEAKQLATMYAREFSEFRNSLDLRTIRSTRQTIARSLAKLVASGQQDSQLYAELRAALRQLDAAEAVQGSAAIVVQPAVYAGQISPTPRRDLMLAIALGILLGVGLAFLVDRLDTRLRSSEEVETLLGFPVLGELPEPPELPERASSRVAMLDFPYGPFAEAIRKLRVNVEFANLDARARIIMVTSAQGGEGKTTVAANLGVALARAGRSVAICDLDTRAPSLQALFNAQGQRGLVDVAFGTCTLRDALVPIRWNVLDRGSRPRGVTATADSSDGGPTREGPAGEARLLILGRRRPPAPADFVGSTSVRQVVSELAQMYEFVILDTPPLLPVSDSLTISEYADAAIVVSGLRTARRPDLRKLRRVLSTFQAHIVGLVVTGAEPQGGYGPYFVGGPEAEQAPVPADVT